MFYPIFTEKLKSPEKVCFKCLHSGCISIFHFHQRGHTTLKLRDQFLETINFSLVMFFHGFKLVYWEFLKNDISFFIGVYLLVRATWEIH